jgi:hypothetical protein
VLCFFGLALLRVAELLVAYYPFRRAFDEASFLNINTGWGFPGVTSIGIPSAYSAIASILVRLFLPLKTGRCGCFANLPVHGFSPLCGHRALIRTLPADIDHLLPASAQRQGGRSGDAHHQDWEQSAGQQSRQGIMLMKNLHWPCWRAHVGFVCCHDSSPATAADQ